MHCQHFVVAHIDWVVAAVLVHQQAAHTFETVAAVDLVELADWVVVVADMQLAVLVGDLHSDFDRDVDRVVHHCPWHLVACQRDDIHLEYWVVEAHSLVGHRDSHFVADTMAEFGADSQSNGHVAVAVDSRHDIGLVAVVVAE